MWRWLNSGRGCPESLWSSHPWKYSNPNWILSKATCCRFWARGVEKGSVLDDLQISAILWVCILCMFLHLFCKIHVLLYSSTVVEKIYEKICRSGTKVLYLWPLSENLTDLWVLTLSFSFFLIYFFFFTE